MQSLLAQEWPGAAGPARQRALVTAGASIALHAAIVFALCGLALPRRVPAVAEPASVVAIFTPAAVARPQEMAASRLKPAAPAQAVASISPLPPRAVPAAASADPRPFRLTFPRMSGAPRPPKVSEALPAAAPAVSPQPAVTPPLAPGVLADLEARIQQSVQDAAIYPPAARLMHREGRAQVLFDYVDGHIGAVGVAVSSQSPMLDNAALSAVRRAILPRAPKEIGSRKLGLLVWVRFNISA